MSRQTATIEGLILTILSVRTRLFAAITVGLLALAGCAESRAPESASFNEADLKFVEQMIPHHQQAVQIADLAETRAENEDIRSLAMDISFIQAIEVEELQGWLLDWGISHGTDDHADHGAMAGMLTDEELQSLDAASGTDFDLLFAQLMAKHHEGAIEAAQTVLNDGKSADVKVFAESVIETQSAELEELQSIIAQLSPATDESE